MNEPQPNQRPLHFRPAISMRLQEIATPAEIDTLRKVIEDAEHGRHLWKLALLRRIIEIIHHPEA